MVSPSSILAAEQKAERVRTPGPETVPTAAWRVVAWAGIALTIVALADIALVFYPWRLGDPGWEFGVATSALSSLPLLIVGFAAWLGSAVALKKRITIRILALFAIVTGVVIALGYIVYLTNVPAALRTVTDQVAIGVQKSVVRTSIMALVFGTGFIASGITAFRAHTGRPK